MPFAKVNKIKNSLDNTFKELRGRKVPCRVPFYGKFTEENISPPTTTSNSKFVYLDHHHKSSYGEKSPKKSNSRLHCIKLAKNSASTNSLDESSLCSSSVFLNKKSNRKKRTELPTEVEFVAEPAQTSSTLRPKSIHELLEPFNDEGSGLSSEKPKKRAYRKKNYVQKLDNINRSEPKRRSRSLCSLGCCNSQPSTSKRSKIKRAYNRKSFHDLNIATSINDKSLLKSSMVYQRDDFEPTSQVVVEFRKKRIYRKKGVISMKPKKKPKISLLNLNALKVPSATVVVDVFKKKTYHKKNLDQLKMGSKEWSRSETPTPDLADDNAMFTPTQMMPPNEDVTDDAEILDPPNSNDEINFSQSTVTASQTSDYVVQHQAIKRGPGRPRKISVPVLEACPVPSSGFGTDDELTCTSSTMSTATKDSQSERRSRKKRWSWENDKDEQQQEEEEVSEYELLRRRNIEENMKMLRQIFMDQGLQLDEKSSDTPKMRKSYARLPLPPPRPKSARIEVKRSSGSLDFSKFCHTNSVF